MNRRVLSLTALFFGLGVLILLRPADLVRALTPTPSPGNATLAPALRADFPNALYFDLQFASDSPVADVELLFGVDVEACGNNTNRATPEGFTPGSTSGAVTYTWDMRQTGSLPPGAELWYQWQLTDERGAVTLTPRETLLWLDDDHPWRTLTAEGVYLHWYNGSNSFAQQLLDAAIESQNRLATDLGIAPAERSDVYIYDSTEAMRDAILFEAQWTGALAYYQHNVILIGVNINNLEWGLETVAHEFTHILVHNLVSHCYASLPTWLDEGIAVYAEKEDHAYEEDLVNGAVRNNSLFTLRSLSAGFSEDPTRARLAYAQSYSVVNYLVDTYGRDKLNEFMLAFQSGAREETALREVYGLTPAELENGWRITVGAEPLPASAFPDANDTPTPVPTVALIQAPASGAGIVLTAPVPTPTPIGGNPVPTPPTAFPPPGAPSAPGGALPAVLLIVGLCAMLTIFIAAAALGIFLIARNND